METRNRTRVAQSQVPPEGVLEGPEPRSPTGVEEDLGLALMMGDGEGIGGGQPEVRVTTSTSGDVPVAMERAPPGNQSLSLLGLSLHWRMEAIEFQHPQLARFLH